MIVITLHDIAEILVWVCIILFFFFMWSDNSEKKQGEKSEDKRSDSNDQS